ncbi:hypothetical protein [Polymorphospora sp. NPDC050346]|uniref:hypothetical protein n=1 Tax=Polymorphospora sp. NPDC050346 TaxID=3155780 RepID=UPI0033F38503
MELIVLGSVVLLNGSMAAVLFVRSRRNPVVVLWPGRRIRDPRLLAVQYLLTALGFAAVAIGGSVSDSNPIGLLVLVVASAFLLSAAVIFLLRRRAAALLGD